MEVFFSSKLPRALGRLKLYSYSDLPKLVKRKFENNEILKCAWCIQDNLSINWNTLSKQNNDDNNNKSDNSDTLTQSESEEFEMTESTRKTVEAIVVCEASEQDKENVAQIRALGAMKRKRKFVEVSEINDES